MARSRRKRRTRRRRRHGGELHPIHQVDVTTHKIAHKLSLIPRKKTLKERAQGAFKNTGNQIKHVGRTVKEGTTKLLNRVKHLFGRGGRRRTRRHKRHRHKRTHHRRRHKRRRHKRTHHRHRRRR